MLGSYVCRQCRAHLTPRRIPPRIPQWQPRATFISLRSKQPPSETVPTEAQSQSDHANNANQDDQRPSYDLFDRTQTTKESVNAQPQRRGRYSKHLRHDGAHAPEEADAVPAEGANVAEDAANSSTIRILRCIQSRGLAEAWKLLEKTYTSADCEALAAPTAVDICQINERRFFANILSRVRKEFCEGKGEETLTPTRVLFKYEQLGVAPPGLWIREAIEPLTHQAMLVANGTGKALQRDLTSLLFELISVWRLFFQCKGVGNDHLEAISPDWNLPAVHAIPHVFSSDDFNYRLQEFHPKAIGSPTLGFCAIYLFNLSAAMDANPSLKAHAAPFLDLLTRALAGARANSVLKHAAFSKSFQTLPQEVQVEVTKEIEAAPKTALSALGRQSADADIRPPKPDEPHATTDLESFNLKVIARAVESKTSPVVLEGHWKRIVRDYTQDGTTSIPPSIYNAFLSGYLILRQAPRSVEVWNHMMSHGVKPQPPTWVAMLTGCEKAKDLDGFNAIWQRMLATGIEPDAYLWTTRVHGLMTFRQIDLGLRALEEMGKRWRSTEEAQRSAPSNFKGAKNLPASPKSMNSSTKPSVEVINGAISGIVQLPPNARIQHQKRTDYVQKILRWGTQFGIAPDTYTFNILIQLYLNANDHSTAFMVLKQMEQNGVQPDISTHTMLITAAFQNGSLDRLSEEAKATRLIKMFEELEAGGLRLNNYVYAIAIDRLLKQYSSHNAVRALIDHMRSRNLAPSAHVYTSLVTFYFQQNPPAVQAVDSLLHQIFDSPHTATDKVLFDRTIEGYAQHGEVGKMMSVLTRMSKNGKHPGFQALTAVIRALVDAGDLDRARLIVRDVQRGEGIAHGGVTGYSSQHKQFWSVAQSLGIAVDQELMGDTFKMGNDARPLDEPIQAQLQEKAALERQPEQKAPEQQLGASVSSTHTSAHEEAEEPMPDQRDLEPPEEGIHSFLDTDADADAEVRQR